MELTTDILYYGDNLGTPGKTPRFAQGDREGNAGGEVLSGDVRQGVSS
jgi:hypothetical protein